MTDQILQQRAHEAAIDHGMWLAPDDDETNYEAFVAGYLRGYSDRGVEATNARDEYLAADSFSSTHLGTIRSSSATLARSVAISLSRRAAAARYSSLALVASTPRSLYPLR